MDPTMQARVEITRRQLLGRTFFGLGTAALATLLDRELRAAARPPARPDDGLRLPHFAPRARNVIYLFQNGAPSHVDLFDPKPELARRRGEEIPESVTTGQRLTTMTSGQASRPILPAITQFRRHGDCGAWVADFLPHTASIADRLCFVRSMHTEAINHAPAITFLLTGSELPGRPSLGAWLSWGLGSANEELPAFVVMTSRDREASCGQIFYENYWGSGFLPSEHQGVKLRGSGDPVLYLSDPDGMGRDVRRGMLDDLARLNGLHARETGDPETLARIAQYELAFRMQTSVPELAELSGEPESVLAMYGPDVHRPGSYARNCLMARRLVERGVRFVQLMHAGWDQHQNLNTQLRIQCRDTDQPSAALVEDLARRGLLEETLVIWGGEFGRTPFLQGKLEETRSWGRDHHPRCFTIWLAGGGTRAGTTLGATDDFAYNVVADPVHVHDLQATVLHLLGIDHARLTFRFQGRDHRLTDVHGTVVDRLLA